MIKSAGLGVLCFIIAAASIGCQPTAQLSPDSAWPTPPLMLVPETPTSPANPTPSASPRPSASPTPSANPRLNHDESPVPDKFTLVRYPTDNGSLTSLLSAEARRAKDAGRQPYMEVYAEWCGPCKALRSSLSDQRMVKAFTGTYIIQVDWDAWEAQLDEAGFTVEAVPAFFEINANGEPTGRTITGAAWGEDIPENMAPPLKQFFTQD